MNETENCAQCGMQISSQRQNDHPGTLLCEDCYQEINGEVSDSD